MLVKVKADEDSRPAVIEIASIFDPGSSTFSRTIPSRPPATATSWRASFYY
jgi:hypothetical protein